MKLFWRSEAKPANDRYNSENLCNGAMGELIELGGGAGGFSLLSALISLAALGIYALTNASSENDDDDSTPGGGLMQPVT